jgi:tetratricopeptide (TPR) repeat protein
MFDALLGVSTETIDDPLLALKRLIIEKTEGTPLFIEEIYQSLIEEGALRRNGLVTPTRPLNALKIPTTVQAILISRIDRLPAVEKELLQILAVIGIQFPLALAREVVKKPIDELNEMIASLQVREFVYEQPATGDTEYTFKHALTQEVAYNSVLQERRKVIHERIGQSIETLYSDSLDDKVSNLAHHYRRSGNTAKAIDYLVRAGTQALQRSAVSVAAPYFEDALELLRALPDSAERDRREIAILGGLGEVTMATKGYAVPDYERDQMRRQALAERLGDTTQAFYSLVGISVVSAFRLELRRAREIGETLVKLADQAGDPWMQLNAHASFANTLWLMGDFIGSHAHSEKGISLFALEERLPPGLEHWRAACLLCARLSTGSLGFLDNALRQSLEFLSWARKKEGAIPLVIALNCLSTVCIWRGKGTEALKHAESLLGLAVEHGLTQWHSFGQIARGQALALLGKTDEAIAEIKGGMATFEATGAVVPSWAYASLAFAYLAAQRHAEGLIVVGEALRVGDRTGNAESKSELHCLNGELLLTLHPTAGAEAEVCFRAAIDTARKQFARLPELRATISLARLLFDTSRRDEGRAMLASIYNWFTEGFDTADLKEAKALLDELQN